MAAIGRRALLLVPVVAWAAETDPREAIRAVLAEMATDLSAGNPAGFLRHVEGGAPFFAQLRSDLVELTGLGEVSSSVELVALAEAEGLQRAKVDWYFEVRSKSDGAVALQRRELLQADFVNNKRKWLMRGLTPLKFFTIQGD